MARLSYPVSKVILYSRARFKICPTIINQNTVIKVCG